MPELDAKPSHRSDFEARLLCFLEREEHDEQRSLDELRALSIDERVLEGECLTEAEFQGEAQGRLSFAMPEDASRFRDGDPVSVGDGLDFDSSAPLVYRSFDADGGALVLELDRFSRVQVDLEPGRRYVVDRRSLGLRGRMREIVRAGFDDEVIRAVLEAQPGESPDSEQAGRELGSIDEQRLERAEKALADLGLDPIQVRAGARAIATEDLTLVQGPPGTGKTRLLATVLSVLGGAGCRIALCAFTHKALDHALLTLRAMAPSLPICKIGNPGADAPRLRRAKILLPGSRGQNLPATGIVAGTAFAFAKLNASERFHYTAFDEAGQIPLPHAIAGMLCSRRWMFFGDHAQLPPVVTADHSDRDVSSSIFEHLEQRFGAQMLETTWRLNDGVCDVVSRLFYDGRLRPAEPVGGRRLDLDLAELKSDPRGSSLAEVLDPEHPVVIARVDHVGSGQRSPEEARVCASLIEAILEHSDVPASEIAVVAPFRAQVRAIRNELQRRGLDREDLVVDTVERIQGQEREVVLISLAVGDPAKLQRRSAFFFSPNRLNVALSRARTKAVLVASEGAFEALPGDAESLRAACLFKRLFREVPVIEATPIAGSSIAASGGSA
ncbi:MAG: AAA domain-containing protein [Planctomycetota bacterium]